MNSELKQKEELIEKYDLEIRQRHDKIEKKQIYIARLNKRYESLTNLNPAEDEKENLLGPLESTITHLTKEITELQKTTNEMQKEWIKTQTELVSLLSENQKQNDLILESKAKETILNQKKLRLAHHYNILSSECKMLESSMKAMNSDMMKFNQFLNQQSQLEEELKTNNFNLENKFTYKLKDMELSSIKNEEMIKKLKFEKSELFNSLIEEEKKLLEWNNLIEIEKETQAAIDPEYGQPELKGMKKEIHRMKLRLNQLKKKEEEMTQEMVRAVGKSAAAQYNTLLSTTSSSTATNATTNGKTPTQAQFHRQFESLRSDLLSRTKENKKLTIEIGKQEEQNTIVNEEVIKQQQILEELEIKREKIEREREEIEFKQKMSFEATVLNQKRAKKYGELVMVGKNGGTGGGAGLGGVVNRDKVLGELMKSEEKFGKLKLSIEKMKEENPKYDPWFARLLSYM